MGCHDSKNRIQVCKNTVGKKSLTDFAESKQYKYNRTVMRKRGHMRKTEAMINEIEKVIIGKREVIEQVLMTILAKGHVLLEDIPGVGKTTLALSFAKVMGVDYHRIQFTPDVTPSDVVGFSLYDRQSGEFQYKPGAVMCNLLLADEINRTSSKTQSALLEVMEEGKITVDGVTRTVEKPFVVIATQNPIETAGTYQLPEAQLDRFLMKINMGYPEKDDEVLVLNRFLKEDPSKELSTVATCEDIVAMKEDVKNVYVHPVLIDYIVELARMTRQQDNVSIGVSPRGTLGMLNAARAYAYVAGRDYVVPEDIKILAPVVWAHRIVLQTGYMNMDNKEQIIEHVVNNTAVPTEDWKR